MSSDLPHGGSRTRYAWTLQLLTLIFSICIPVANAGLLSNSQKRDSTPIALGYELRVLPIGDSITYGAPNPPFDGYRKELHQMLVDRGNSVDFVGSESAGDFADNQNEGHRGKIIDEISNMSAVGIYAGANIVLLHAGTNDMNFDIDPDGAPDRLSNLIGYIYEHSANAAVFVAQVIPSTTPAILGRIQTFNQAVPGVVDAWVKKGKNVMLVDMYDVIDKNTDLVDNLHPNPTGYSIMAKTWYNAIVSADSKNWIVQPGAYDTPPTQTSSANCKPTPQWVRRGVLAEGAKVAYTDGDFKQAWNKVGVFSKGSCAPERLFFPDLDGDGFKDWACVDKEDGKVTGFLQKPVNGVPGNNWDSLGTVATGKSGRNSSGVFFADLNGDGKDDYIYVDGSSGDVNAWINGGLANDTWQWIPLGKINGNDVGATPENLQMGDLDGDGRADFMIVNNKTGEVTAWLNGGPHELPDYYKIGLVATGASKSPDDRVIIGSFTGSGRDDYMLVGANGKVTGLANRRQNSTLVPEWAFKVTVADGPDGAEGRYVRMVDVDGDGKVDYLLLDKNGGSHLWLNKGTGGRWQIGDGVFLTDLNGDGVGDYVWVDKDVNMWGYVQTGSGENSWDPVGQIRVSTGQGDLHEVRMAVLSNTSRSDLILVDDAVGGCLWGQNVGQIHEPYTFAFTPLQPIATGPRHTVVAEPYNWEWDSRRVTFADLTGDGFADYLYVNVDGAVLMWKHLGTNPPTWGLPHLVADGPSVGVWWTEIQFADVNDDGAADYIHVDRFTGRSEVWWNEGVQSDGSIQWSLPMSFAAGVGSTGYSVRIADMTGDGRSDFVVLDPDTGGLQLVDNQCWSTGGGSGGSPPASITEVFTDPQGDTITTVVPAGSPITTPIVTTDSKGSTHTFVPSSVVETFTDGQGHTFKTTLPPGSTITTPITVVSDGSTQTLTPPSSSNVETFTDGQGHTFKTTLPPGSTITTPITVVSDGSTQTLTPPISVISPSAPVITPPPQGSPGSIPDTIPAKSAPSPHVEITISGETYYLPKTESISILQSNGSPLTLFPNSVVAGSATVSVPPISKPTTLTSSDGSTIVDAQPGDVSKPSSGGASGFAGLLNVLKSLAGTATTIAGELEQISEQGAEWAAGRVSNDAFSSGVSGLIDSSIGDLDTFIQGLSGVFDEYNDEVYELTDDGLRRVFESRIGSVEEFDILRSLRNLIRNLKTLQGGTIDIIKSYWQQGALAAAVFAAAEEAIRNFGTYPWADQKPVPTKSSSSSPVPSATSTPYLLSSKDGTDPKTFKSYINELDGGKGYLIAYPNLGWQSYQTSLTAAQAKQASLQSFMYYVQPVTEGRIEEAGMNTINAAQQEPVPGLRARNAPTGLIKQIKHHARSLRKRIPEWAISAAPHLKLISEWKDDENKPNNQFRPYAFDSSLGENATIYIIDTGYTPDAPDFAQKAPNTIRAYTVPNILTLGALYPDPAEQAPEDMTDYGNSWHGTGIASLAGGAVRGVASKATLAIVKFRNAARTGFSSNLVMRPAVQSALVDAWDWVLNDVEYQYLKADTLHRPRPKFIINYSYSGALSEKPLMDRYVEAAWAMDVLVTIPAGNRGADANPPGLHDFSPQEYGTTDNALITCGGTDENGNLWIGTTPDLGKGGSITTYAQGYNVSVATGKYANLGSYDGLANGTSCAAPQVAGLAAYFFGITSLAGKWGKGTTAKDMKNYIISLDWQRQRDPIASAVPEGPFVRPAAGSVKVAWNAIEQGLCNGASSKKRLARRQSDGDQPIVNHGTTASEFAGACSATTQPSTSPTATAVAVGYYKECGTDSCGPNDQGTIQLAAWAHSSKTSYDPCSEDENPTWLGSEPTSTATGPSYPVYWGSFDASGLTGCSVTTDENSSGSLKCNNGKGGTVSFDCSKSTASLQDCDTGDTWQEMRVCTM